VPSAEHTPSLGVRPYLHDPTAKPEWIGRHEEIPDIPATSIQQLAVRAFVDQWSNAHGTRTSLQTNVIQQAP
jgi:hypothetical protein